MKLSYLKPASTSHVRSTMDEIPNDLRNPFLFSLPYVDNVLALLDILERAIEREDQEFQNDMELNF